MRAGFAQVSEDGIAFSFTPPVDSGRRHFRRRHFHAGRPLRQRRPDFLADNSTSSGRPPANVPELAGLSTTYLPSVPQKFADVDRDKVMRQGVNIADVYKTLQTFMGGYL